MSTTTIESVASRLDGLERQNVRLRWVAGGLFVAATILMVEATVGISRSPRVVEAERLVIRDKAGRVRAKFGIDGRDPTLQMFDLRGREQVSLGVTGTDASALTLSDRGQAQVRIEAMDDGGSALCLLNSDRRTLSHLWMTPAGAAGLSMTSGGRLRGMTMGVLPDGQSALLANDPTGRETGRVGSASLNFDDFGLIWPPRNPHAEATTTLVGPPAAAKNSFAEPVSKAHDVTIPEEARSSYRGASN